MEAINIFLKKEIEDKLFDRTLFNIKYWEFMRALISCEANTAVSKTSSMFSKNKFSFKRYLLNFKYLKSYFLRKRTADILIVSQSRRVKHKDTFRNNYIDFYVDILKKKYNVLVLEEPSWSSLTVASTAHYFPYYTENMYLTDIHEIYLILKIFLFKCFRRKKYKRIIEEYNEIKEIVNKWYEIETINFKKYFINSFIRLYLDAKHIVKLLKKINPKIIMLHYMPSIFKEMLICEANKLNIKTIEIQHGTITKIDPLVNKCLDVSKLQFDNQYIFSFGENQISKYALSIKDLNKIKYIGFPFFEEVIKNLKYKEKKYILVISQSTIGEQMANFTSKLANLLIKNNICTKIVFKYHPNEISRDYKCLKKSNIIEIKNEKNIYDIQNESILQIGSYSTSLYEGFAMKIPTLIIKTMFGSIETVEVFDGIKKGVYYINEEMDVLNFINRDDIMPLEKDIKKLWRFNSEKNLIKSVKEIMKECD